MSGFGNILHSYLIKKDDYSISAFAKDIGISAGLLNHIFNGKRTMAPEKFQLTLNCPKFDLVERHSLQQAYFKDRYGEKDFEKLNFFSSSLASFSFVAAPEIIDCTSIKSNGYCVLENKNQIFSGIKELFTNSDGVIYTNIPHENNSINSVLFELKKQAPETRMIRFISYIPQTFSEKGLVALYSAIRFAQIRVNTYSLNNGYEESLDGTTLFPYFVLTENMMILLDTKNKSGVAFSNNDLIKEKYHLAEQRASQSYKAVTFYDTELEAVNNIIAFESDHIYALKNRPCILAVNNLDFIVPMANRNLPNKSELRNFLDNRRGKKTWHTFVTQAGLEEMLSTGKTYELSETYLERFTTENKKEYLRALIETVENSDSYYTGFLSKNLFASDFIKTIDLTIYENCGMIATYCLPADEKSFIGQVTIQLVGGELLSVMKTYITDFLPLCGEVLPKQVALTYLKGLLIECH